LVSPLKCSKQAALHPTDSASCGQELVESATEPELSNVIAQECARASQRAPEPLLGAALRELPTVPAERRPISASSPIESLPALQLGGPSQSAESSAAAHLSAAEVVFASLETLSAQARILPTSGRGSLLPTVRQRRSVLSRARRSPVR